MPHLLAGVAASAEANLVLSKSVIASALRRPRRARRCASCPCRPSEHLVFVGPQKNTSGRLDSEIYRRFLNASRLAFAVVARRLKNHPRFACLPGNCQCLPIRGQSLKLLETLENTSSAKAGVGGSTPSLASVIPKNLPALESLPRWPRKRTLADQKLTKGAGSVRLEFQRRLTRR